MPDSNNKRQQPKTLSNSLRLKSPNGANSRQNVSYILNRLPFLRTLNEAQNQLLTITPIWHQWCANQKSLGQSNMQIVDFASLASLDKNILSINCTQSSAATLLKHQQNNLLQTLHDAGFGHIQSVRVQMSPEHLSNQLNNCESNNDFDILHNHELEAQTKESLSSAKAWPKPSAASLKSIEATQSLIKNEQLAASLKRLAETLKKAT